MITSWSTAVVLLGTLALLGLAMYLDHSIIAGVVGMFGTVAASQLPPLIQRIEKAESDKEAP